MTILLGFGEKLCEYGCLVVLLELPFFWSLFNSKSTKIEKKKKTQHKDVASTYKKGGRAGTWRGHNGASLSNPTSTRFPRAPPEHLLNTFTARQTGPAKPSVFPPRAPRPAAFLLMPTAPPAPTTSEPDPNPSVDSFASPLSFLAMPSLPARLPARSRGRWGQTGRLQAKTTGRADHVHQSHLQTSAHFPPAGQAWAFCPFKSLSLANDTKHRAALAAAAQHHQAQGVGN